MSKKSSPVIIAGMHRSGTSLLTSIMAASGVDVGGRLVPADRHNPRGYYEDLDFLALNRRILGECCDENDGGHPDWGWTESESLDRSRFDDYQDAAAALLESLPEHEGRWGFKDPRSTLLLDFWHRQLGDAGYLFVYRSPWEVADSMQRLGADVFLRHPEYALRIWAFYNRHLLDFYRRHRDRCVLVSTTALLRRPADFGRVLSEKLDLELDRAALDDLYEAPLLGASAAEDPLIGLVAATSPEVIELLEELDAEADLPSREYWRRPKKFRAPEPATQPKVSVVIPCRDHGQFLIEAIASVERSADVPYELIVIDDGSEQERTVHVLDVLERAGYRIERETGRGLSAARNRGFGEARAEFVLPLDADNRLREGFLAAAVEALEDDSALGAVYGEPWEFGAREGRREVDTLDIDKLLEGNYIDACALVRKAMWWDIGGYDEALPAWEDWDFWIRVATRGWSAKKLETLAFDYRVRPNSLVSITRQDEVLESIVDHITSKHRQLFHGHLTKRLGHVLASWPRALERKRQALADEAHELRAGYRGVEEAMRQLEERARALDSSNAELRLQLERLRVEKLEVEKVYEQTSSKLERAALLEEKARGEADLQAALVHQLQTRLDDQHAKLEQVRTALEDAAGYACDLEAEQSERAAELGDLQLEHASELAALRTRLEEEQRLASERLEVLEKIHSSRGYRLMQRWWRLAAGVKRSKRRPVASSSPVEDGALGS